MKRLLLMTAVLVFSLSGGVQAHHGGLALEGDEREPVDEEATQWQQEVLSNGYRLKFLSYPQFPLSGEKVRLVFEVQSAETGFYLSDLPARLEIATNPAGARRGLNIPPVDGIPGYYEVSYRFSPAGEYDLAFQTEIDGKTVMGNFSESVRSKRLVEDGYVLAGRVVVFLATMATLVGASLSLKHRVWGDLN